MIVSIVEKTFDGRNETILDGERGLNGSTGNRKTQPLMVPFEQGYFVVAVRFGTPIGIKKHTCIPEEISTASENKLKNNDALN